MGETLIGIKMADQSFYPVMEEGYQGKKRLVLTTVRDNQNTVQIDLYKSSDKMIDPALYVGSLVIENIENSKKGEPEIEVILGIDENKNLNAVARNLRTGTKQRLQTSLENLEEHETYDIPDFEIEEEGHSRTPARATTQAEQDDKTIVGGNYPFNAEDRRKTFLKEKNKSPVGKIVLVTLVVLIIIGLAALIAGVATKNIKLPGLDFLSSKKPQPTNLVVENISTEPPATSTPPTKAPEPTKKIVAPPTKAQTDKELTKAIPTQNTVKINGVSYIEYKIVWGDTLWWIANKYYGNPWQYRKIYRFDKNRLKDPDLIIAGTKLYIPKK